ncbi:MAG: serine hydrolase [Ferruginibacter sp.]
MKKLLLFILLPAVLAANAQMPSAAIDSLADLTLKEFDVPGMAIGVVKDGKLIHAKGYGVRSLKTMQPVNENTLFGIASNSKAFTAAAIAMLIEEGKMNWDDKVRKYIPEFTLYDPYVSEEFTIRDLLCHRSGLGLGAGDLMFFPEGGNFTVNDIIQNLRYLKPVSSFRSKYDYNNNMFIVAGEVIKRVSGSSWEDFIETRIMKPLGFTASTASYNRVKNNANIIDAHAPVNGKAVQVPHDWNEIADAAGGIMSNITDLSKWVIAQLNGGTYGDGKKLFGAKMQNDMWNIQTPFYVAPNGPYGSGFGGYGLGWVLSDVKGHKQVGHTGGLIGTVTQITLIPDMKLGIIVLTNQQVGAAFGTITNTIKDSYLGYQKRDWLKINSQRVSNNWKEANAITDSINRLVLAAEKIKAPCLKQDQVTGTYHDNWMGDIHIIKKGNVLSIRFERSPRLTGHLLYLNNNTYVARWDDRSYDADAYITFTIDKQGVAESFKMEAISPMTDFSFDFHDLDPKRKK